METAENTQSEIKLFVGQAVNALKPKLLLYRLTSSEDAVKGFCGR